MSFSGLAFAVFGLSVATMSALEIEFENVGRRATLSALGLVLCAMGVMLI